MEDAIGNFSSSAVKNVHGKMIGEDIYDNIFVWRNINS